VAVTTLNKVLYVDADFSTAVDSVQNFLNTNYPEEFNDYVNANIGQALIDIIAYSEQNLMWYLNRKVNDLYFPTAVTPNSISKVARGLGYKAKTASAAEALVTVRLPKGPYNFPVSINPGFQLKGPANTIWEYRGAVAVLYAPGETSKTFVISQGQTVVNSFISTGSNDQSFVLRSVPVGKYAAGTPFTVTVNGVAWEQYPVIPYENIDAYETNLSTTPPSLTFGDGVEGNVPPLGAAIQVSYVVCDGFRGRIASNSIKQPVAQLVASFQNIPIAISQVSGSVGGDDPEDIRSITVNAPVFQKTQDRAITKTDYDFLSNQFTNVARADAQVIRGVSGDLTINSIYDVFYSEMQKLVSSSALVAVSGEPVASIGSNVSGYMGILYEYLDTNLTDSCRANIVQVAVLGKDSARKYVSPLQSTLDGIKAYLDARKDVVHTVVAVSGLNNVINANVLVQVRASVNSIEDDVVKSISDCLVKSDVLPLGILVERGFNLSLYVWEIQAAIRAAVVPNDQIDYLNIKILGPAEYLDSGGNLICPKGYVIQAGTVTISKILRY